ncbi:hypothetical protein E2C01_004109 [Portunus trituberculatus]|uniref:Uncharacterized protein n=1 Tax=Portunus trituberculatus TaxID=210409 RepID=A0A5B7CVF7_PORTR|nr:hypothetical protein [Portunus trituberculatus]
MRWIIGYLAHPNPAISVWKADSPLWAPQQHSLDSSTFSASRSRLRDVGHHRSQLPNQLVVLWEVQGRKEGYSLLFTGNLVIQRKVARQV